MSLTILLLGLAALVWPTRLATRRLGVLTGAAARKKHKRRVPRPTTLLVVLVAGALGGLVAGAAGVCAAMLVAATAWRGWLARRRAHRAMTAADGLAEALRSFVGELRAGAHPATAAESVARDAERHAAAALRAVAGATRLGGDVERALAGCRAGMPELAGGLTELGVAWSLVLRHGLPLADVLDATVRDLDERLRFARQVKARLAGPRASATVLALLPVVGIALGEAMGAHPLHILTGTVAGQALLALGSVLVCAGVLWSARLTGHAAVIA